MVYNADAEELRRCRGTCNDGRRCSRFAVWGDPFQRCVSHGGRVAGPHVIGKTHAEPCRCEAYPYPHRPGSGYCEWPNPPQYLSNQRPGVHTPDREDLRALFGPQPLALLAWRHHQRKYGHR
jgi:hypothetical protein